MTRPYRSVLYIPGSKERALDKARGLPVDAIIFDLEDAVTPDAKVAARATLAAALAEGGYGNRARIVRINGLDTVWGKEDAKAVAQMDADAVLLPKVNNALDVQALADLVGEMPIWAMMESCHGNRRASGGAGLCRRHQRSGQGTQLPVTARPPGDDDLAANDAAGGAGPRRDRD